MSRLDEWSIVHGVDNNWREKPTPYHAPEQLTQHLHGLISDDFRFRTGEIVTTSTIKGQRDGKVVTRSGTLYEIGDPHPDYEAAFPNAKERFMKSLPEVN